LLETGPQHLRLHLALNGRPLLDIVKDLARINSDTVIYREDESAARNDDEIFKVLDGDESGQIDRDELRNAFLRVLDRDSDGDKCVTFDEFLPEQSALPFLMVSQADADERNAPRPALSDLMRDVRQPTLPLRLFKQYDRDQNRYLSAPELGWEDSRVRALDTNHDGRLEQSELTRDALARLPADLDLAVELSGNDDVQALRVLSLGRAKPKQRPAPI
jgi:hypothetical protein